MPKMKLGAVIYALAAIGAAAEVVRMIRHDGRWSEVHGWVFAVLLTVFVLTSLVLIVGTVTRRGLIADDGPWICQNGWAVLIALMAVAFVVLLVSREDMDIWPSPAVVFLPHFVRRLQESYYDGVAEAEREIAAVRAEGPDEEPLPGR